MCLRFSSLARAARSNAACSAVLFCTLAVAQAYSAESDASVPGRIDFEDSGLPAATIEVDLSQTMFRDLLGLGDAALEGVAETLMKSVHDEESRATRMAAEQLGAAREILDLTADLVREGRVRIYEDLPDEVGKPARLVEKYETQLSRDDWETVVRVRDGDDHINVALLRSDGAIRGAFVVIAGESDLILANLVCDASPENVKKLTAAATQIGLNNGLRQQLEATMRKMNRHIPSNETDDSPGDVRSP